LAAVTLDSKQLTQLADLEAVAVAIALPWSTSATAILLVIWLITLIPTLNLAAIWREVKTLVGGLPVLLWLLGAFGVLWADVSWPDRVGGLGSFHRLLMIPVLLAHFRRSENGHWVLYGFFASAAVLLLASWALVFDLTSWQTNHDVYHFGVVVHDVVAQSTIFLICLFALVWRIRELLLNGNWRQAIGVAGLAALFLANLVFVAISRADVAVIPVLAVVLGWRWFGFKGVILACITAGVLAAAAWQGSPYLRGRLQQAFADVEIYRTAHVHNDVGDHIEFAKKSIAFVREAPVIGHGTGSIPDLFRRSTIGQTGAAAVISVNPHNQFLAVAIQLGLVGATVLLAMWLAHYLLFRAIDLTAWIGTVVVVESVVSSVSSSHLFDFVHGWLYVLGVGIIGGMVRKSGNGAANIRSPTIVKTSQADPMCGIDDGKEFERVSTSLLSRQAI
jgi:O-antigen ligase